MSVTDVVNDGWNTDFSTGFVEEYDFTINTARFRTDERYMSGNTLVLAWDGTPQHEDLTEDRAVFITLGKGWVSNDGIHLERSDPRTDKKFNGSTKMAHLIDRCVNTFQIADVMRGRGDGTVFDATIWEGLRFHIKRQILDPTQTDAKATEFPDAFLGVVGGATPTVAAATNGNGASNGAAVSLRDQVKAAFAANTDYQAGQSAALQINGVSGDAALLGEVLAGPTGALWVETH